jgi:hypothetical protein
MKVTVSNGGTEIFSFTTEKDLTGIYPKPIEKPAVLDALAQATQFLNHENAAPELPPAPENPSAA